MNGDALESVIESVQEWAGSRNDMGRESDTQTALVVSCSMSSCKLRGPLWPVDTTWNAVSVETLGNQTQERYEGKTVPDSTIEHRRTQHDITAVLVVGHTDPLRSLVGEGFKQGVLTESLPLQTVQYRSSSTMSANKSDFSSRYSPRR
ncbi:hypothetical protein [Halogeometricum borinquense]|uniref:hypothetical protein n=1 Tax=Halogeometricum borinquense TaxID=60847 RepID=UPI001F5D0DB4|nr:hypothetical protein [Halogeometricum borinquense]